MSALTLSSCADLNQAYDTMKRSVRSAVNDVSTTDTNAATTENLLSADGVTKNCPQVQVIGELSSLSQFSDVSQPKDYNLISRVQLQEGASNCIYSAGNVRVDVKLILESVLGAKGQALGVAAPSFKYPFFVAVADENNNVLAKEMFTAPVNYRADALRHTYFENIRQIIPIESRMAGPRHKILVGFQLNDAQLAYNRATLALPTRIENGAEEKPLSAENIVSIQANDKLTVPTATPENSAQATQAPLNLNDKVIMELNQRSQNAMPVKSAPPL